MKKITKKSKFLVLLLTLSLSVIPFLGLTVSSSADSATDSSLSSINFYIPSGVYLGNPSNMLIQYLPISVEISSNFSSSDIFNVECYYSGNYFINKNTSSFWNTFTHTYLSYWAYSNYTSGTPSFSYDGLGCKPFCVSYPRDLTVRNLRSQSLTFNEFKSLSLGSALAYSIYYLPYDNQLITENNFLIGNICRFVIIYSDYAFILDFCDDLNDNKSGQIVPFENRQGIFSGGENSFSSGYDLGFKDAKSQFYTSRYDLGYDTAKLEFYNSRYEEGYNVGVNYATDLNQFTFGKLLDSVFYAPLKYLYSLFNFEVLGVNLYPLILTLITLAIAVSVIRLIVR